MQNAISCPNCTKRRNNSCARVGELELRTVETDALIRRLDYLKHVLLLVQYRDKSYIGFCNYHKMMGTTYCARDANAVGAKSSLA